MELRGISKNKKRPQNISTEKTQRKCGKCFRPIQGHPKPCGQLCILDPILTEAEQEQEQQKRLDKERKRKSTQASKEATKQRMATVKNKEATKRRMATPENKEATKRRLATPQNKIANRKRMATIENKMKTKLRMASDKHKKNDLNRKLSKLKDESISEREKRLETMRRYKILVGEKKKKLAAYKAWCDPLDDSNPQVDCLNIPKMSMVCSHCNALMFPFETQTDKKNI